MSGGEATRLDVRLDFLGKGIWSSSQFFDVPDKKDAWDRKEASVTGTDHIQLDLAPRGGFVGWIRKR